MNKPLPAGLNFDSTTGIISGTPLTVSPPTSYTVTAYNSLSKSSATVSIKVISTNANLSGLAVSNGALSPVFSDTVTSYADTVSNTTRAITLTPNAPADGETIKINGIAAISGKASRPVTLNEGNNTITVMVTTDDKTTTKIYAVTVFRNAAQTITFNALRAATYGAADIIPAGMSTNTAIPVTYTSSNVYVAAIINGNIHIAGAGTATITASLTRRL